MGKKARPSWSLLVPSLWNQLSLSCLCAVLRGRDGNEETRARDRGLRALEAGRTETGERTEECRKGMKVRVQP